MPETRMFETRCKGCGRVLVTTQRLIDPDFAIVTPHLRVCISEPLGKAPMVGEIMKYVNVSILNVRAEASS